MLVIRINSETIDKFSSRIHQNDEVFKASKPQRAQRVFFLAVEEWVVIGMFWHYPLF